MPRVSIFRAPLVAAYGGDARPADLGLQRGDVDDPSPAAGLHAAGHRLADEEGAGDVGGHQGVPVLQRELGERRPALHPGVVDADVDRADRVLDRRDAGGHRSRGR